MKMGVRSILAGLFIIPLGVAITPTAGAAVTGTPVHASVRVSEKTVPAMGGTVKVRISSPGADWCGFSSSVKVTKWSGRVACHRTITRSASIGGNPTTKPRRITLRVQVRDANTQGAWKKVTITQQAAPVSVDDYSAVPSYALYGNGGTQALGDCTLATVADLLQTWATSAPLVQDNFLSTYTTLVGGPGGPNVGLDVPTVLNYWKSTGIDGYTIPSWRTLSNYTTQAGLEDLYQQWGPIYATINVPNPDATMTTGTNWTTVEAPAGSTIYGPHAVAIVGYDAFGPYFATWGKVQHVSWSWWTTWGTGAYGVVHNDSTWQPNLAPPSTSVTPTPSPAGQPSQTITTLMPNSLFGLVWDISITVAGVTGLTTGQITITDNGQPANCSVQTQPSLGPNGYGEICELNYQGQPSELGNHVISASYSGDASFAPSSELVTVLVQQHS